MRLMFLWIAYALIITLIAWIIPGIKVENFPSAMLVCVIIGLINVFIKPFLQVITLPINLISFGLFSFVLNALLFLLAGKIAPGFEVSGFMSALIGSMLLSIFAYGLNKI